MSRGVWKFAILMSALGIWSLLRGSPPFLIMPVAAVSQLVHGNPDATVVSRRNLIAGSVGFLGVAALFVYGSWYL